MKTTARTILFGGIIVATTAAIANTTLSQEAAEGAAAPPVESTAVVEPQASEAATGETSITVVETVPAPAVEMVPAPTAAPDHRLMSSRPLGMASIPSAFPGAADDEGPRLIAKTTHADRYARAAVTQVTWAFPGSADEAGHTLHTARLQAEFDGPVRVARLERGTASGE